MSDSLCNITPDHVVKATKALGVDIDLVQATRFIMGFETSPFDRVIERFPDRDSEQLNAFDYEIKQQIISMHPVLVQIRKKAQREAVDDYFDVDSMKFECDIEDGLDVYDAISKWLNSEITDLPFDLPENLESSFDSTRDLCSTIKSKAFNLECSMIWARTLN